MKFLIVLIFLKSIYVQNLESNTINDRFKLIKQTDLKQGFENEFLIRKYLNEGRNKMKCLSLCQNYKNCYFVLIRRNDCFLLNYIVEDFLIELTVPNDDIKLYKRADHGFIKTPGLQNYWPANKNLRDVIGKANLYGGTGNIFTNDQYNSPNSAISLINGYLQVPDGTYFSAGDFTAMAWVKLRSYVNNQRLIDFGNGDVVCALNDLSRYSHMNIGNSLVSSIIPVKDYLDLNKWQHLTCVSSGLSRIIYINGTLTKKDLAVNLQSNIDPTNNYIGKIYNQNSQYADVDIDDLKIFNRALSQEEIQSEMWNTI